MSTQDVPVTILLWETKYMQEAIERKGKWMPATVINLTEPLSYIVKRRQFRVAKTQKSIKDTSYDDRCQPWNEDD